jgi:hypothetical protein
MRHGACGIGNFLTDIVDLPNFAERADFKKYDMTPRVHFLRGLLVS